jgi:septation ring formation regulator EzrA
MRSFRCCAQFRPRGLSRATAAREATITHLTEQAAASESRYSLIEAELEAAKHAATDVERLQSRQAAVDSDLSELRPQLEEAREALATGIEKGREHSATIESLMMWAISPQGASSIDRVLTTTAIR